MKIKDSKNLKFNSSPHLQIEGLPDVPRLPIDKLFILEMNKESEEVLKIVYSDNGKGIGKTFIVVKTEKDKRNEEGEKEIDLIFSKKNLVLKMEYTKFLAFEF